MKYSEDFAGCEPDTSLQAVIRDLITPEEVADAALLRAHTERRRCSLA